MATFVPIPHLTTSVLRPVGRYFRLDWNYAIRVARFPALRPASLIIAFMPILQQIAPILKIEMQNMWLLWIASLIFISALLVLRARCPGFIQEYQYYSQYAAVGHSHRWIVWLFCNNLESLADKISAIRETIEKHIALPCDFSFDLDVCRLCPLFSASTEAIIVNPAVQDGRDIYVPIGVDGLRFVLPMQESDPNVEQKQRELFWILLVHCGRQRLVARTVVWSLFAVAGFCFVVSVINNVFRAAFGASLLDLAARVF
jgi:hypothetical protein